MTPPGPAAGADARAMLIPWYADKPEVLFEEYLVIPEEYIDHELGDLEYAVASALTIKQAAEKAQLWVAVNGRPAVVVHVSYVRVATVGKEIPA